MLCETATETQHQSMAVGAPSNFPLKRRSVTTDGLEGQRRVLESAAERFLSI
jgi:hypothetical protein